MNNIVFKNGLLVLPRDLDESTTVPEGITKSGSLAFDFQFLRNINSYGIRFWILLMRSHSNQTIEFHRCTREAISAFNIIRDLLGPERDGRIVKSLEIPYGCDSCQTRHCTFVNTSDIDPNVPGYGYPVPLCARCGELMELEFDGTEYLTFLQPPI